MNLTLSKKDDFKKILTESKPGLIKLAKELYIEDISDDFYFNQDNFLKAEELANTLIKEYSNNIFLLKILGVIHAKQGNFNKALEYNKRVITVNPKDSEGYNNLGICYKNLNFIDSN